MRLLMAVLAGCLACLGQDAAGPCSVKGVVLNAATGEPLKGVELTLIGGVTQEKPSQVSTTSDEHGKYRIESVPPGRYLLVARKSGFTPSYGPDGAMNSKSMFALDEREKTREIVVRLEPYATIAGRIRDEAGKPVAGAFALAYRVGNARNGKRLLQVGHEVANEEGGYRIADLPPGKYYISAIVPGGLGRRGGAAVTYYPGTAHFETAVALDVAAGMDLPNIDVRLVKAGTVCVGIRPEAPREGLRVSLSARHSVAPAWSYDATPSGEEGRFEVCGLLAGDYDAVASDNQGYSTRQPVHVDESSGQEVRLPMPPRTDVAGRLVFDGQRPEKLSGRVELRPVERNAPALAAEVDEAGNFIFKGVNPDRYLVALAGVAPGSYVRAIHAGETDMLGKTLELAGVPPGALEIRLSPNAGSVQGVVNDAKGEKPAPGAIVVLLPEEPERRDLDMFFGYGVADESGAFSSSPVAPGRYRAVALDVVREAGLLTDPESRRAIRAIGAPVDVREKSVSRLDLKVTPASDLQ